MCKESFRNDLIIFLVTENVYIILQMEVGGRRTKHLPSFTLCVPELRNTERYLQTNGYIFDGTAVATGNEFRSEVLAAEAIHLSSFCANKELLAFSTESYGGHRLLQLGLSAGKRGRGQRYFFLLLFVL